MNEKTDVAVHEPTAPALISKRRLVRWATVVGIGIIAVLACWQDPSYAAASPPPAPAAAV